MLNAGVRYSCDSQLFYVDTKLNKEVWCKTYCFSSAQLDIQFTFCCSI